MYTGIRKVKCNNDDDYVELYEHPEKYDFYVNEYILVLDKDDNIRDKKRWDGTQLVPLKYKQLNFGGEKLKPLNVQQEFLFDLLQNDTIIGKMIMGKFGTGKTMVGITHALDMVIGSKPKYDKMIFLRNMQLVKDMGNHKLGSLPGSELEKIFPFIMPVADILGSKSRLEELIANEKIIPEFMGFIRGRSYKNSIIFLTEAENQTREHLALIMSRVGEGSILIIDGDSNQIDSEIYSQDNGLLAMSERLKGNKLFGMATLEKNERGEFSTLSDLLLTK